MERIGDANDEGDIDVFSSERMQEEPAAVTSQVVRGLSRG
jgi:hypothetical protein